MAYMRKQNPRQTELPEADQKERQRKTLEKLATLYEKLDEKLEELEAKIDNSPNLAEQPRKPR